MSLIDKSHQASAPVRKTKGVKIVRSAVNGHFESVKTVRSESTTLSGDLSYVFSRNVRDVTKKK